MRTIILILLLVAAVGLGVLAGQRAVPIKELRVQRALANDRSKAGSLALEAECAQQAKIEWLDSGYKRKDLATYQNHYNVKLNKCVMALEIRAVMEDVGWNTLTLYDAFEHKEFASYIWRTQPGKKFSEVPPVTCTVQAPSGGELACRSREEFDELIKAYMEG